MPANVPVVPSVPSSRQSIPPANVPANAPAAPPIRPACQRACQTPAAVSVFPACPRAPQQACPPTSLPSNKPATAPATMPATFSSRLPISHCACDNARHHDYDARAPLPVRIPRATMTSADHHIPRQAHLLRLILSSLRPCCQEHYAMFKGPPVQLICPTNLSFPYVPGHLLHICFEVLKNSLCAVVERYGVDNEDNFPPIKVVVVEGKEDITIKISDEGGGIARSAIPLIWMYMYMTMENQGIYTNFQASDFKAPMVGFGYGLPLSRLPFTFALALTSTLAVAFTLAFAYTFTHSLTLALALAPPHRRTIRSRVCKGDTTGTRSRTRMVTYDGV
ncbi:hypothetical protein B0H34DRAFT_859320 [Crassisporium funariophilum]|nr:hypothetical protein B0H34DRAFT_859320 [Crassisporium funariophilum]